MADDKYKPKSAPNGGQTKLRDWWDDVVEKNFSDIYGYFCKHIAGTADRHTADMIDYADGQDGTVKEKLDEKADKEDIGSLDDLQTADKSTIVAAINALFAESVKEIYPTGINYAINPGIYRVLKDENGGTGGYLFTWALGGEILQLYFCGDLNLLEIEPGLPGLDLTEDSGISIKFRCGMVETISSDDGEHTFVYISAEWRTVIEFSGRTADPTISLMEYPIIDYDGYIPKERLGNEDGGFAAGAGASAQGSSGAAIGKGATSNAGGCAVGENAWADTGAAIGKNAFCAGNGGAVGVSASAVHGFAGGGNAKVVWSGGAVGSGAYAGNGFSGGLNAKVEDTEDGPVDAIQLGAGTNSTPKTLQVYNYQLMDAEGHVPIDRLALIKQYVDALLENNVLTKTNTIPYTPTMPYHPATKAYVDAHSGGGGGGSNRNYALHSKEEIPASRQAGDIFFIWDGFDSTTPIDPPEQNMRAVQYTNMVISVDEPENAEYWGKIVSESKEGTSDIPVSDIVSGDMEVAEEPSGTKIFFNKIK